ncbi:NAD(P)-dependent oxidoreductase [Terasakiella sp. A23]|uniref:NAD-dependent epimerase/dehydratase family protein n=1 Tax=Terasakiella sp. FCG-A23 TaxID=3080561 RepID=UPI0029544EB0|nr:NAD(P)-dependent oxidoreductase [Terasakiella sp. A23]MDV7340811.1 NAD(P)-dependent oxidoreductase [Terasakiella sp. A23]
MKILVTGGAGFLGSHVADALTEAGHEVFVFDLVESAYLRPGQTMIIGDVTNFEHVCDAVKGVDVIYHLAALADIDKAIDRPRDTMSVNLMGTVNMLEAARLCNVQRFIFSSSIYVYSDQGSFYRTSKQACEHLIQDYHDRYGLNYSIVRYGSLYGPRADSSNAVFRMLKSALEKGVITYGGSGKEVREYIHIRDAALMSADVLDDRFENAILHLTGRERMTTGEMLEMMKEILNNKVDIQLNTQSVTGHYIQTPYNYTPRLGRKMTRETYIDIGLGLLDMIQFLDQDNPETHPPHGCIEE